MNAPAYDPPALRERARAAWAAVRDERAAAAERVIAEARERTAERVRELLADPDLELDVRQDELQPGQWYVRVDGLELMVIPYAPPSPGSEPAELFLLAIGNRRMPHPLAFRNLERLGELLEQYGSESTPPPRLR